MATGIVTTKKKINRIDAGIQPVDLPYLRFTLSERESLRQLAKSSNVKERRLCVEYLWLGTYHRQNYKFLVEMCDELIPDRSQYVRAQSLWLLGDFVKDQPELVWLQIVKWGSGRNSDIRCGIACYVLEHLLQYHFSKYFPKVKVLIEQGNNLLANTLSYCWKFGDTKKPANAKKFDALIKRCGKKL